MSESTEIATLPAPADDETGLERLQRRPIIDRIDQRTLALIKKTIAISENEQHPITDAEIGHFLELCANYGLDPFAREAWIAKSKTGKLLIMVGRDGLRKIVNDNGLVMRGATIYASDEFTAEWIDSPQDAKEGEWTAHGNAPFTRVTHKRKGFGKEGRGDVVGAWSRVYDQKTRVERAYFDAPLTEYKPKNASDYSPWSKQVSAMMLGAVERQASRQATPLGGLLVDGEQYTVESTAVEIGAGEGSGEAPPWEGVSDEHVAQIEALMAWADEKGLALFGDLGTVRMRLNGQSVEAVEEWIAAAEEQRRSVEDGAS